MSAKTRQSLLRAKLAQQLLSKAKGFTLIELLVVIVIVGILTAIAVPQFLNQIRRARAAEGQTALTAASRGAEVYRMDTTVYPEGWANIDPAQCNKSAKTAPDYCGPQGDKFVNDPWESYTANYAEPTFDGGGTPTGAVISTEATTASYVNRSNQPIKCEIGVGDQATQIAQNSEFYVGRSCNVFD